VDLVNYEYSWLTEKIVSDNIYLATIEDIAAMKLNAIIGRGSKKDFIDLFFILKKYNFNELFKFYNKKYHDGSIFLVLKSIVYFDDADKEEMPFMFEEISWDEIKSIILNKHAEFVNSN
jgi:hypothetical protein